MADWLVSNHDALEALGGLAGFVGLLALVFGGLFGLYRLSLDRKLARNHHARELYYDYCRLSIDNPEYFLNFWARSNISDLERQRYIRFVCYMINGIEDIFASDTDEEWRIALREDFRSHVDFLASTEFDRLRSYFFIETCRVIDSVIAEEQEKVDA